jgi:sorbitol-6-phosphate 2-dehydrogenase
MTKISKFTAAIRMKASREQLATARFFPDKMIYSEEQALNAGWSDVNITEVDVGFSLDELKRLSFSSVFNLIVIKNSGYIITANSPTAIDQINKKKSFDVSCQNPAGRLAGKTTIVTGAAQGFGQGIAENFFREGANVVIADLNEEKGQQLANEMNRQTMPNRALFVKCNVAEASSVDAMVETTVNYFGGVDALISNAGILRAGGLDEMEPDVFDWMTRVNYNGFFHCAKAGSAIMKIQTDMKQDYFADIIQINSKSGLKGSNKNFAYAGAKFGGIGLTQSFALELMPHRIKVNAVCPGNFFEGPLWSDPEKGLFVQYLNANKVPGAKSIDDVKKHYESQVPAGRGCRVKDVVRALFYAMEQEYETGQAIPVTGGQNMLS